MNDSMLLAHRQALLTAIARVHVDDDLSAEERAVILPLLLGCMEDTEGDDTLDALDAIFEDYDNVLSCAVTEAFAALTNTAHILGQASSALDASEPKPRVQLVGQDGNAFAILGRCQDAANRARWNVEQWQAFRTEATAGDYDHLLRTVQTHFDVR